MYDYNLDDQAYEQTEDFRRFLAAEACYTDALAARSSESILGDVADLDEDPDALAAFLS